jgi:hypothetical protein
MGSTSMYIAAGVSVAIAGLSIYYMLNGPEPNKYTDGGPIDNRLAGGGTRRHRKHRKGSRKHRK